MNDDEIIKQYNLRSESAIKETIRVYGKKLERLAYCILHNNEDSRSVSVIHIL